MTPRVLHIDGDTQTVTIAVPTGGNVVAMIRQRFDDIPVERLRELSEAGAIDFYPEPELIAWRTQPKRQREPCRVSEPNNAESTILRERARRRESAKPRERASSRESTNARERARHA